MRALHILNLRLHRAYIDVHPVHFHNTAPVLRALNYYICAVRPYPMPALRFKFCACLLSTIAALFKFHAFIADKIFNPAAAHLALCAQAQS